MAVNLLSQLGYNLGLPGLGISEPFGTPYNKANTPQAVQVANPYSSAINPTWQQPSVMGANSQQSSSVYGPTRQNYTPSTVGGGAGAGSGQVPQGQQQQQQGPSGPSQGEQDQINQQYSNSMNYLNQLEADYQQSGQPYQNAATGINTDYANMGTALQHRGTEQNAVVDTQQGQVDTTAQNALMQARQLYNELSQGQLARYGTGSSAGPAASEILGRATAQQFGQVANTQQQGTQALGQERVKITNFLSEKAAQFDQAHQDAINNLQEQFRQGLRDVQARKTDTENAKAQANLSLLQQYREQANQITQAKAMADIQLQQWAKAKDMGLGQVAGFSANNTIGPNTANALGQANANFTNSRAGLGGQPVAQNVQTQPTGPIILGPNALQQQKQYPDLGSLTTDQLRQQMGLQ